MPKILGLDVGNVRVGTALGDLESRLASPHITFQRAAGEAENKILELIQELKIHDVVVGIPLDEKGQHTAQAEKIDNFCRRLRKRCTIEIHYIDEYLSTLEAKELAISAGKRSPSNLDSMAAALILQTFLNSR